MRGHFSEDEPSFLVEAFKDTKLSPQQAGRQFKIFCDDAMTFRNLDDKWKITSDEFLKKIENITLDRIQQPITVETPFELWMEKLAGKADGQQMFMGQKYKVNGDLTRMIQLFQKENNNQ